MLTNFLYYNIWHLIILSPYLTCFATVVISFISYYSILLVYSRKNFITIILSFSSFFVLSCINLIIIILTHFHIYTGFNLIKPMDGWVFTFFFLFNVLLLLFYFYFILFINKSLLQSKKKRRKKNTLHIFNVSFLYEFHLYL